MTCYLHSQHATLACYGTHMWYLCVLFAGRVGNGQVVKAMWPFVRLCVYLCSYAHSTSPAMWPACCSWSRRG